MGISSIDRRHTSRIAGLALLALIGIWFGVRTSVETFRVTSGSMAPTIAVGQRLSIDTGARTPAVGEIVVFRAPSGAEPAVPVCGAAGEGAGTERPCGLSTGVEAPMAFVKRVVAGPGDEVAIVHGRVVRNGRPLAEPYAGPCSDPTRCSFPTPIRVPAGEYYVLGDNRSVSDDSRFWGPVPSSWIIGTVVRCSLLDTVCRPL